MMGWRMKAEMVEVPTAARNTTTNPEDTSGIKRENI
jgi:hypothetical protein